MRRRKGSQRYFKMRVVDSRGRELSPCSEEKAERLLKEGKATMVEGEPPTIRLSYEVEWRPKREEAEPLKGKGKKILLHICCGPCSTYTIGRLREEGFSVTGFWYNPNVHPFSEHERRRECMEEYAGGVGLPMIWWPNYEMVEFLRRVSGHEAKGDRCSIDYRMRLEKTAEVAVQEGYDAFTSTLLISPHQDQALIREIGEELSPKYNLEFYFENFRRGWRERGRLAKEHNLYRQNYCGCIYSEWERYRSLKGDEPGAKSG
ncbi:MAG: epoxyqueuosine reductase QueH [Anaerolineae bacterium]